MGWGLLGRGGVLLILMVSVVSCNFSFSLLVIGLFGGVLHYGFTV